MLFVDECLWTHTHIHIFMFACDFAAIWFKWWEGEFVVENILDSCIMQSKPRTCNLCVCVRVRELRGVKRESTLGLTVLTLSLSLSSSQVND